MAAQWQVGKTQSVVFGAARRYGYGFSIQDYRGAPLFSVAYEMKEDAEKFEEIFRQAIESAIDIAKP